MLPVVIISIVDVISTAVAMLIVIVAIVMLVVAAAVVIMIIANVVVSTRIAVTDICVVVFVTCAELSGFYFPYLLLIFANLAQLLVFLF